MSILRTKNILPIKRGFRSNSYYDKRTPYTQRELDEYRISEGYEKYEPKKGIKMNKLIRISESED